MSKPRDQTAIELMSATILSEGMKRKIQAELAGKGVDEKKFQLAAVTALRMNPALGDCNPQSVYNAVQRAAHDGLLPDGREGVITVYNVNVGTKQQPRWEKHAQWNPMVYGIIKKLGKHRMVADMQVVHENDEFSQEFGDNPTIMHRPPKLGQPRGKEVGVYAIVKMADGHVYREVMDIEQIDQIRKQSKNADGVWAHWWGEMARKSVLRRLSKRIPIPEDVRGVIESEDLDIELEPKATDQKPKLIEQIPGRTLKDVVKPEAEPAPAQPVGEELQPAQEETGEL